LYVGLTFVAQNLFSATHSSKKRTRCSISAKRSAGGDAAPAEEDAPAALPAGDRIARHGHGGGSERRDPGHRLGDDIRPTVRVCYSRLAEQVNKIVRRPFGRVPISRGPMAIRS
jgi:hypothetical protein